MQIDNLYIENFKRFSKISIDFEPGVNLFVGENSSGKTTILEAVNVAMGGFFVSQVPFYHRDIKESEIRLENGTKVSECLVGPTFKPWLWNRFRRKNSYDDKTYEFNGTESLDAYNVLIKETKIHIELGINSMVQYGDFFFSKFRNKDDRTIAPIIAYYSTQRLFSDSKSEFAQKYDAPNGRRNGYVQCLSEHAIKIILDDWLGKAVTRRATKQIKDIFGVDNVLENVEGAIIYVAKEFLGLNAVKIYQEPDFDNEVFLQFEKEEPLPISYYADGFRNLLYLVMDLMWRASQLNPWLTMKEIAEQVPGVVTIDEIDLHLHPRWQAKVIPVLQTLFPKVQFFITTHSPTVVANFDKGTLYVIDKKGENIQKTDKKYFGRDVNYVLRRILGSSERNQETQRKLDELTRLVESNAPETEIENKLNPLIEELGSDDKDISTAIAFFEWNKIKNEGADAVHS